MPEIKDDDFYRLIEKLAAEEKLDHVLEIGSSAGGGSTSAFLSGLSRNPGTPKLFCVEVSKARFAVLSEALKPYTFAFCYNRSSVSVEEFPDASDIVLFYRRVKTNLNQYPLPQVLDWLRQDIAYVASAGVDADAIEQIKSDHNISQFDMVLIDGSEFTGDVEFAKVKGARIILLDDTNTFKCHGARECLLQDADYELIADNQTLRNGFSAFRRRDGRSKPSNLPIHFFTIVLNGEPFIRYHETVFAQLKQQWHWHIIEGVAALKHDTAWSVAAGGRVADSVHNQGRSNDGTSDYLDDIALRFPDHVTIYRKPLGEFWDGKREMVGAPLPNILDECLLWQIDADELWTAKQIDTVHALFTREPDRTAAMYWCWYFVGPRKIISTRYNYAQNPQQEWLRTWRYQPGDSWFAHEPPLLARGCSGPDPIDVAKLNPFTHDEMELEGAVFQHFAYARESQLAFKETYYGYSDAKAQWRRLQEHSKSGLLRDYLKWVTDDTIFDDVEPYRLNPLAATDLSGEWFFKDLYSQEALSDERPYFLILLDGLVWQGEDSPGGRFWANMLREWAATPFIDKVLVVDRAGTAPRIEGVHYWTLQERDPSRPGGDSLRLERICRAFGVRLFISTSKSSPTATPSCIVDFDDLGSQADDDETRRTRSHAAARIVVGLEQKSAKESGQDSLLSTQYIAPGISARIEAKGTTKFCLPRDSGTGARPFVIVLAQHSDQLIPALTALSFSASGLEECALLTNIDLASLASLRAELAPSVDILALKSLDGWYDIVAQAHALICPAKSQATSLIALEAFALGCPVILCGDMAIGAFAGDAAIRVGEDEPVAISAALNQLLDPSVRREMIDKGQYQVGQFCAKKAASALVNALVELCSGGLLDKQLRSGWAEFRRYQKAVEDTRTQTAVAEPVTARGQQSRFGGVLASIFGRAARMKW